MNKRKTQVIVIVVESAQSTTLSMASRTLRVELWVCGVHMSFAMDFTAFPAVKGGMMYSPQW